MNIRKCMFHKVMVVYMKKEVPILKRVVAFVKDYGIHKVIMVYLKKEVHILKRVTTFDKD